MQYASRGTLGTRSGRGVPSVVARRSAMEVGATTCRCSPPPLLVVNLGDLDAGRERSAEACWGGICNGTERGKRDTIGSAIVLLPYPLQLGLWRVSAYYC